MCGVHVVYPLVRSETLGYVLGQEIRIMAKKWYCNVN